MRTEQRQKPHACSFVSFMQATLKLIKEWLFLDLSEWYWLTGYPYFTPHTNIKSIWIADIHVKGKTIKLLEEHTGEHLSDSGVLLHLWSFHSNCRVPLAHQFPWHLRVPFVSSTKNMLTQACPNAPS